MARKRRIAREIGAFLLNGGLYRGSKPVLWSIVEKTALAEAEVEYHDISSPTIHIRFPVVQASVSALEGASVVIWTTTPWTMPGNRGLAYGADFDYVVVEVTEVAEGSLATVGEKIAVADVLLTTVCEEAKITSHSIVGNSRDRSWPGRSARTPSAAGV